MVLHVHPSIKLFPDLTGWIPFVSYISNPWEMSTAADRCAQILTHLTACLSPDSPSRSLKEALHRSQSVCLCVCVSVWEREKAWAAESERQKERKDGRTWWNCVMNELEWATSSVKMVFNCVLVCLCVCVAGIILLWSNICKASWNWM